MAILKSNQSHSMYAYSNRFFWTLWPQMKSGQKQNSVGAVSVGELFQ